MPEGYFHKIIDISGKKTDSSQNHEMAHKFQKVN